MKAASTPPPVVLAHGWGGSAERTWCGSQLESALLAADRTVITVDLPGHGPGLYSHDPADYADIAEQFSSTLPPQRPLDAVGFSLGGKLLLQLAADDPGRFRRVALLGVGANAFTPENAELIANALLEGPPDGASAEFRNLIEEARSSHNDPSALTAVIRRPPRPVEPVTLSKVEAEVLLVVGEGDTVAGPTDQLAGALPSCQLVPVPDIAHGATPATPQAWKAAAAFLTE